MIELFLILFLIFIALPIGIGYLIYFLIKKYWSKKIANYFAVFYSVIFLIISGQIIFEDQLFTKNDAKKLIEEQNIILQDDFKLITNRSETAIGDYYHTFELQITEKDKTEAINKIKTSDNFKLLGAQIIDYAYAVDINRYTGKKQIQNYETPNGFVREYFQPNGQGYAPTFRRIIIEKNTNKLIFEDIND